MMRYFSLLLSASFFLAAAGSALSQSQDAPASASTTTETAPATPAPGGSETPAAAPETPKAAAASKPAHAPRQAGAPAPELKKLEFLKGTWSSKMTVSDGSSATGKAHYAPAFQGMVIEGDHDYTMGGKPMKGRTTWGWDVEKQQYQLVWVNSMGSDAKMYYGTFPNETSLSFFTTYMQDGKAVTEKVSFTFPDPNTYVFTVENDAGGTMAKVMEETATRGASSAKSTASKSAAPSAKPASKPATASSSKKKAG